MANKLGIGRYVSQGICARHICYCYVGATMGWQAHLLSLRFHFSARHVPGSDEWGGRGLVPQQSISNYFLSLTDLDSFVHGLADQGIATSTMKTYRSGQ